MIDYEYKTTGWRWYATEHWNGAVLPPSRALTGQMRLEEPTIHTPKERKEKLIPKESSLETREQRMRVVMAKHRRT
jgi:hypothetical protein